jgi:hypothetical protein
VEAFSASLRRADDARLGRRILVSQPAERPLVRYSATIWLAAAMAFGCFPGERQVNTYETIDAARSDRLFDRGWVPDVLPPGSGPIIEAHDLDTNGRCSKSQFPGDGASGVHEALLGLGFEPFRDEPPTPSLSICPFSVSDLDQGRAALSRAPAQSDDREFAVLADGVLFFWSTPK